MRKVVILTTGGTIASLKDESGFMRPGALSGEELLKLADIRLGIDLIVESVFQLPSPQISWKNLLELKTRIEEIYENDDVNGVVVTCGTSTLEEVAYFLDLTIENKRPVVLTGAQRGPNLLGSDSIVNLRQAILVANSRNSHDLGCLVVFNEKIFMARHVKKIHSYNVNGFGSYGYGYLGIVDRDDVLYYVKPFRREVYSLKREIPLIYMVKCGLDTDGEFIRCAIENKAEGIIVEGAGRGQVAIKVAEAVTEAIEAGVVVVLTTSCDEGVVYPVYNYTGSETDLKNRGAVIGGSYESKKARVKLAVLLSAGIKDKAEIQKHFSD